jgi:hypothetical protein
VTRFRSHLPFFTTCDQVPCTATAVDLSGSPLLGPTHLHAESSSRRSASFFIQSLPFLSTAARPSRYHRRALGFGLGFFHHRRSRGELLQRLVRVQASCSADLAPVCVLLLACRSPCQRLHFCHCFRSAARVVLICHCQLDFLRRCRPVRSVVLRVCCPAAGASPPISISTITAGLHFPGLVFHFAAQGSFFMCA